MMSNPIELDLPVDLNTMDDTGLPWTFLDEAIHPERVVPGAHIVVGEGSGEHSVRAVAVVVDIVEEPSGRIVHVMPLRGPVSEHAHLLISGSSAS